jgi:hypothetical protein
MLAFCFGFHYVELGSHRCGAVVALVCHWCAGRGSSEFIVRDAVGSHGFRTQLCTSYIRSGSTKRVTSDVCTMDRCVYGDNLGHAVHVPTFGRDEVYA